MDKELKTIVPKLQTWGEKLPPHTNNNNNFYRGFELKVQFIYKIAFIWSKTI